MNKWFNRNEYAQQLLNKMIKGEFQKYYTSMDLYMMAYVGIRNYSENYIRELFKNYFMSYYGVYEYEKRIKDINTQIKKAQNEELTDIQPLIITKPEIEEINKCIGIEKKKVLFTLLCMAKYNNALHKCDSDWVSTATKDIFNSADVVLSHKEQDKMIYELAQAGLITNSMKITSNSIHINFISKGEPVLQINDLRGLGAVYVNYIGGIHMRGKVLKNCRDCDAPFIDKSKTNNRLYCKRCRIKHL